MGIANGKRLSRRWVISADLHVKSSKAQHRSSPKERPLFEQETSSVLPSTQDCSAEGAESVYRDLLRLPLGPATSRCPEAVQVALSGASERLGRGGSHTGGPLPSEWSFMPLRSRAAGTQPLTRQGSSDAPSSLQNTWIQQMRPFSKSASQQAPPPSQLPLETPERPHQCSTRFPLILCAYKANGWHKFLQKAHCLEFYVVI